MVSNAELVELTNKYLMPNYGRQPLAMVRGSGSRIWDADGTEYIDLFPGFGAGGVAGHCHPAIVSALKSQAEALLSHGNLYTNAAQVELARALADKGFGGMTFYCHSGAEANEAALKLTRLAAGEGRYKIISFTGCFHGRTMGSLSLTPGKYQKGFEPMLGGNVKVDFMDLDAARAAVDDETAGIIVEPVQGEGGVNVPTAEYMRGLRALCDERKLALICDEVWTAPARTGRWFAYQHYGIEPDVMTLGKATGGGTPVAACVARPALGEQMVPGTHGCTMGGNPLCAAAGVATMKLIEAENLLEAAEKKGAAVVEALTAAGIGRIREVRGKGLMIGIGLDGPGKDILAACLDRGLIINCTQDTVLRLAPALTISESDLSSG
ncbi:MAG: aspartate aminotransferase family protein, partial [Planctomycetota bacterium]